MHISQLFQDARIKQRKLFIPYLTCGDPNLSATEQLVKELIAIGADIIELGVPFSDPLADGVTNQLAHQRALKNRINLADCCNFVKQLRMQNFQVPIILYTYFNPILRMGIKHFAEMANTAGVNAVLIVDLPLEETQEVTATIVQQNIGIINLITPTSHLQRIEHVNQLQPEFIYYISRTGVTGVRENLSATLAQELAKLRQKTSLPIAVGFGISTAQQAATVSQFADAVIVGSALVKHLENPNFLNAKAKLLSLARDLRQAIK